jgi:hypothetical protein
MKEKMIDSPQSEPFNFVLVVESDKNEQQRLVSKKRLHSTQYG